ncbi:hypothetical protein Goshw_028650, partial [Gossypium schwendimanii]|nr:hypothetical protein [Gossypium schwendimanii]
MKRLAVGPMITLEYNEWWVRRINDNIQEPSHENKLEKKIEQMEEENMNLRLDADVQKLEVERLRKGKTKAEEDLDILKTDYKKLRLSMRTAGLGKILEQWREKIQEEKNKADIRERKFQETLAVQADTLSVKYELESNRGQELALLLRKIGFLFA